MKKERKKKNRTSYPKVILKEDAVQIELGDVKKIVKLMRAINHPLRHKICDLLQADFSKHTLLNPRAIKSVSGMLGLIVTDIFIFLKEEQSIISQQLKILRQSKVVLTERQGKNIVYYTNSELLKDLQKKIEAFLV